MNLDLEYFKFLLRVFSNIQIQKKLPNFQLYKLLVTIFFIFLFTQKLGHTTSPGENQLGQATPTLQRWGVTCLYKSSMVQTATSFVSNASVAVRPPALGPRGDHLLPRDLGPQLAREASKG